MPANAGHHDFHALEVGRADDEKRLLRSKSGHRWQDEVLVKVDTTLEAIEGERTRFLPASTSRSGISPQIDLHQHQGIAQAILVDDDREQQLGKGVQRQSEREGRPAARLTGYPDPAFVQGDKFFRDEESEAEAFAAAARRARVLVRRSKIKLRDSGVIPWPVSATVMPTKWGSDCMRAALTVTAPRPA